jgi:hypothetical protein
VETIKYNISQPKTNYKTGEGYWVKHGIGEKGSRNFWIKLESLPIPNKDGEIWLNLFERKDDEVQKKNER